MTRIGGKERDERFLRCSSPPFLLQKLRFHGLTFCPFQRKMLYTGIDGALRTVGGKPKSLCLSICDSGIREDAKCASGSKQPQPICFVFVAMKAESPDEASPKTSQQSLN